MYHYYMSGDPIYTIEKLWEAVSILASGTTSLRRRLYDAYISSLHVLKSSDFPDDLKQEFNELNEALTWVPIEREGEGTLSSTTNVMSDDEAKQLANNIVNLLYEMVNRYPEPKASS